MTSPYQIRFVDRVIVKGKQQPISIDEVLDPETEGAFQFCFYTPKKRFLQNRGAPETQLVRELKLQTQPDFTLRLEHDCRHEFKAAKTCFYLSSVTKRQKKIRIHSHLLSKRRDLGKNSLTLLIEPSL